MSGDLLVRMDSGSGTWPKAFRRRWVVVEWRCYASYGIVSGLPTNRELLLFVGTRRLPVLILTHEPITSG